MKIQDTNEKGVMSFKNIDFFFTEYSRGSRNYTRIYIKKEYGNGYKCIHDSRWKRTNAASLRKVKFDVFEGYSLE